MRFTGKTAIVTGSGQGIGEAYAKALAADGARVVVADLNADGAERVAGEIAESGGDGHRRQGRRVGSGQRGRRWPTPRSLSSAASTTSSTTPPSTATWRCSR